MSNAVSLRLPKYRLHKAKGLAVVTLVGPDHYLGKYNSAESKEMFRRLVAEHLQGGGVTRDDGHGITIVEVMAEYLKFAKGYYRKGGEPTREYGLIVECCRFLRSLYSHSRAVDFGPLALKAVRHAMIEADHSRKYVNKNIERIRRMFKWAVEEELIPANVPQALSMVAGLRQGRTEARETPPVLPVADAVVEATLPRLPEVVADMVRLQRLTGARPGEICLLRPQDLDRSGEVWQYRPESHKTEHHGKMRVIHIGPKGQEILWRYLARAAKDYCFRPCDSEAKRRAAQHAVRKAPLSCGNKPGSNRKQKPKRSAGDRYVTGSYRRAIHRGCDKAFPHPVLRAAVISKLPKDQLKELRDWQSQHRWAPNQLRHAAATEARREFGLEAAQVILGHSQANVIQIYAERDLAKGVQVAKQIG